MHALLERALAAARHLRASDVHLKAGLPPVLRVDGELRTLTPDVPPLSREFLSSLALSLLNDRRREILERTGDVSMSLAAPDGSRQRVQISQVRGGTTIAVRLVPAQAPTLDKLGLPAAAAALVARGPGLVLVAGGSGAGKTTTLAALANEINGARASHIVTIEDPVEIVLVDRRSLVVQREVGLDAPSTPAALRATHRQDVDVLVVGELRDAETVDLALHAAETGRLVFAGVGARDAVGAAGRVVELGRADRPHLDLRGRLARALRGIVAQQLVKRADGRGRAAAVELLLVDDETRGLLADPAGEAGLRAALAAGRPPGSQNFDAALVALARDGKISRDDAVERAPHDATVGEALGDEPDDDAADEDQPEP
jgi:twitching motility protein PilT